MTYLGPRPERPELQKEIEKEVPEFGLRLQAKAGLTGYAQVYGKYNTTFYDKLLMDLMYISKPSILEDFTIMLATVKIVVYAIAAWILKDITVVLIAFLVFEVIITVFFWWTFVKEKFMIKPYEIDWGKTKEILGYGIPMGIYVLTNSLCRDIDKMLIGGWYSTDQYAIYANCATLLPFDIISASFLMILIPILTRYFGERDYIHGRILFKNYLKIGYYTAFTFTIACMILSKEMVLFLYGEKYLSGQTIFILYTIVDMIKFANMSIVLSASGKTKTLMSCSLVSLVANAGWRY